MSDDLTTQLTETPAIEIDSEGLNMLRFFTTFNPNDVDPRRLPPVPLTTLYLTRYNTGLACIVGYWVDVLGVTELSSLQGECLEVGSVTTETMPLALFMGGQRLHDLEEYRRQSIPTPVLVVYLAGFCLDTEGRRVVKLSEFLTDLAPHLPQPVQTPTPESANHDHAQPIPTDL